VKSNARFVVIWAALVPVLTGAALLVSPLHIAHWSEVQTGLVVATVNATSALVLAAVAYLWAHSVKEPAALAGALGAFTIAVVALGNGFTWWDLTDDAAQLVVAFVGSILVLLLAIFVRTSVTPIDSAPAMDVDSAVVEHLPDPPAAEVASSSEGEHVDDPNLSVGL